MPAKVEKQLALPFHTKEYYLTFYIYLFGNQNQKLGFGLFLVKWYHVIENVADFSKSKAVPITCVKLGWALPSVRQQSL